MLSEYTGKNKISRREFIIKSGIAAVTFFAPNLMVCKTGDAQISNKSNVIVSAVGDVTLGYHFNSLFKKIENEYGNEEAYKYPFAKVKQFFEDSIAIANLECALTSHTTKIPKEFNFRGEPHYARCLSKGSIEIVNGANNHSYDFGVQGLEDTINALESEGILYCGIGRNLAEAREAKIIETNSIKIAFLGYADVGKSYMAKNDQAGVAPCFERYIAEDIPKADDNADITVVSFHYGEEYSAYPSERQKYLSRYAIEQGADIVLGHHPHVIQGIEEYKGGIIFYSLGNFCFGGNINPSDKDSFIARIDVSKNGINDIEVIPVKISSSGNNFQPYPVDGHEAKRIIEKIKFS